MYYSRERVRNASADFGNLLVIPNLLTDFINSGTTVETTSGGKEAYCYHGDLMFSDEDYLCPKCGVKTHINQTFHVQLKHVPHGGKLSYVMVDKHQFICPRCGKTLMQRIPFQAEGHRTTEELKTYAEDLLRHGLTNKEVSWITGLHQATVKAIDKARLEKLYTVTDDDGSRRLIQPERQARYLAIDEIKIHDGHKYATHIIDLETGHILWIQGTKKKQVVYDFIEHVGMEWMQGVVAIACDMNADFEKAFLEKCPHLQIVFDHFHIVKNFNDKVVSEVRKDEQRRLKEEGQEEAAKDFKKSRYILMSNRETLQRRDAEAAAGGLYRKGSTLFNTDSVPQKGGREERYDRLIAENTLLFTVDLVKDMLDAAYRCTNMDEMRDKVSEIIHICQETENTHFMWFGNLLNNHLAGIISHAWLPFSSGTIEGFNRKIGVIRNQAYGFPDDEYFFLKLLDASRQPYVRNPKSHKVLH